MMNEFLILAAVMVGIMFTAYSAGKTKVNKDIYEDQLDAIDKANEARDSISNGDDARSLLLKHKA